MTLKLAKLGDELASVLGRQALTSAVESTIDLCSEAQMRLAE